MRFDAEGNYIVGSSTMLRAVPDELLTNPIPGKLLTAAGLASLPEPSWIIRDLLATGSMAWLAGAPGAYKSFMAIDWACAVSLGVNTCGGRRTQQTNVLYMCCEGTGGLKRRVDAWSKATGLTPNVAWLPESIQIGGVDWSWLRDHCADTNVGLLVIDTYSRVTLGLDEIDGAKQGVILEHMKAFRKETDASMLNVHHKSAAGKTLRGHTSLEGDADTIVTLEKDDNGVVTMCVAKQKDTELPPDEYYRASPMANSITLTPCEKPLETSTPRGKR